MKLNFFDEYLDPIRKELKANGIDENEAVVQEKLRTMYQRITGIETFREDPLKKLHLQELHQTFLKFHSS